MVSLVKSFIIWVHISRTQQPYIQSNPIFKSIYYIATLAYHGTFKCCPLISVEELNMIKAKVRSLMDDDLEEPYDTNIETPPIYRLKKESNIINKSKVKQVIPSQLQLLFHLQSGQDKNRVRII